MATSASIRTVTEALRTLLSTVITDNGVQFTTKPPNDARPNNKPNQINIFLYQVKTNPAMRNLDIPARSDQGYTGEFSLPLDLQYLFTFYGLNDDERPAHELLGDVIRYFHDNALLRPDDLENIAPDAGLHLQIQRLHVILHDFALEEMSRLWTMLQTGYRLSVIYDVSAVLIETERERVAGLPTARINIGVDATLDRPLTNAPQLLSVSIPDQKPAAQLGDDLVFLGTKFDGTQVRLIFENDRLAAPVPFVIPDLDRSEGQIRFTLPNNNPAQTTWVAGVYRVTVEVQYANGRLLISKTLSLLIAPRITPTNATFNIAGNGSATIGVIVSPQVRKEQEMSLLIGGRVIPFTINPNSSGNVNVTASNVTVGDYHLRLRVDGIDSPIVDYSSSPLGYDDTVKVTLQ
jgi:hypothetical protein